LATRSTSGRGKQRPPGRARLVAPLDPLQVGQDGEQEEEPAEHVAALRDPGHRFNPQRVDAEDEGREGAAQEDGTGGVSGLGAAAGHREETPGDQIHERRVGGVQALQGDLRFQFTTIQIRRRFTTSDSHNCRSRTSDAQGDCG
jgi:hypothetical protein